MKIFKGYTLIEIVILIAIFSAAVFLLLPYTVGQLQGIRAEQITKDVRSTIFVLQQDAFSRKNTTGYGIALFSDHYIVYEGLNLASASVQDRFNLDARIRIENINLLSGNEIRFIAGSQKPSAYGSFIIAEDERSYRVNINQEGLLTIDKL